MAEIKIFVDIFHTSLQIFALLGAGFSFLITLWRKKQPKPQVFKGKRRKNRKDKTDRVLLALYASTFFFLLLFIAVYVKAEYFPGFVITYPHSVRTIVSDTSGITVEGIGAHPGETIIVFVSDKHTKYEQREQGLPSESGNWAVENIILQKPGYEYSIWAEVQRNGVTVSTDNRVKATRVDSRDRITVFVTTALPYLIVVILIGAMYILRQRRKTE